LAAFELYCVLAKSNANSTYSDSNPLRYTVQNVPTATPPAQSQIVSGNQLDNTINFTDLSTLPQPKQIMSTHSDLGLNVSQSLKENNHQGEYVEFASRGPI
jgi:alanine dehydrogenase